MSSGYIKITSCDDSSKWYNGLIGTVVQYDAVVPGMLGAYEYRCYQPDGYINFVSQDDAQDLSSLVFGEPVPKAKVDKKDRVNYAEHIEVDRFELESKIMECWNVTDDINLITKHFVDSPEYSDMSPKVVDAMMNKYFAIAELYEVKFESLWMTFESLIKQNKLK